MVADVANATTPGGGKNAGRKKHKFTPFHAPTQQKAESMRDQALDEWLHAPQRAPHTSATSPGTSGDGQGTCFTLEPAPPFIPLPDLRLAPVLCETRACPHAVEAASASLIRLTCFTLGTVPADTRPKRKAVTAPGALAEPAVVNSSRSARARSRSSRRRARARGRRRSCDLITSFL